MVRAVHIQPGDKLYLTPEERVGWLASGLDDRDTTLATQQQPRQLVNSGTSACEAVLIVLAAQQSAVTQPV